MTESLCGFQRPCAPSTGVPSVRRPIARARPPDRASSRPGERRSSCWGSSDDARARELGATRSGPIPTLPASDAVVQFSERPGERSKGRGARIHGRLSCPCALRKRCVCTTSYPSYITPAAVSTHTHPIALAAAFDDAHVRARTCARAHTNTHTHTHTHTHTMPCSTAAADDDDNNATADDDDDDARARALPLPHFMTTSGTVGARLGTSQRRRCLRCRGRVYS